MVSFISGFLRRRGCRRIRRIMLGFRFLNKANSLASLVTVKQALTNIRLELNDNAISLLIFGAGTERANVIIRQYLLALVANQGLERALLYAAGKQGSSVVYYLPPQWRNIIRQHGFKVAGFRCSLAWNAFVMLVFFHGLLRIGRMVFDGLKHVRREQALGKYVYFADLTQGNLPQSEKHGVTYDIVTWYSRWSGGYKPIDAYCHSVKGIESKLLNEKPVIYIGSGIPSLTKFHLLLKLILWGIGAALISFFDLFRGRWWNALMFSEAVKAKSVQLQSKEQLAVEYLFHNMIYRPLWTYEAERVGSKITFYFYALWTEPFRCFEKFRDLPLGYGLEAMNWPHYLVWDTYQADFIKRAVGNAANISIVGSIWFTDSAKVAPVLPENTIVVFDVSAMRESIYKTLPVALAYYTPEIVNQFLSDIYSAINDCNGYFALKRKRDIGNEVHPKYSRHIDKFLQFENFINIEPDISPLQLIGNSNAIISIPFTSTAVVAKELDKPSIYYDPTGLVRLNDIEAHGIPIINTVKSLRDWVRFNIARPNLLK